MTRALAALVRWACDPDKIEVLEGDLRELLEMRSAAEGRGAARRRYLRDALSVCFRQSRFTTPAKRRASIPIAVAALVAGVVVMGRAGPPHYTVDARDPAGRFTLEVRDGRVLSATVDGKPVAPGRLVQLGDTLAITGGDHGRDFRVTILPGGIEWKDRKPAPQKRDGSAFPRLASPDGPWRPESAPMTNPAAATRDTLPLVYARAIADRARARLAEDAGRLWGVPLDTLLWSFALQRQLAFTADPRAPEYRPVDGLWIGPIPSGVTPANTSLTYSGRRWAMVLLPLPADTLEAVRLLIHEGWHVAQPALLELPRYNETGAGTDLLDGPDGRAWLALEWRALAQALVAIEPADPARHALLFRARRYALATPEERTRERALDLGEGLPEYTAWRLAGGPPPERAVAAELEQEAPRRRSWVRSFPYFTGPAYGLLLDRLAGAWRSEARRGADLQTLLARALGDSRLAAWLAAGGDLAALGAEADEAARLYGADSIRTAEAERWREQQARLADLRHRFLEGPTLRIRPSVLNIVFDPNRQAALGSAGTVMVGLGWSSADGAALDAPEGGLVPPDWSEIRLPAVGVEFREGALSATTEWIGAGWWLRLPAGWVLERSEDDWVARPPAR